jgi:dihydropyrimidine dehydrogenase (NAD+) subunit PreA
VKNRLPDDVPVIGDISGSGANPESWAKMAKVFEEAGADAIELDTACPITIVSAEGMEGSVSVDNISGLHTLEMETLRRMNLVPSVGDTPEVLAPIVKACVDAVRVPIGVKPSAESGFPKCVAIAKLCAENGATFVTNINAPLSVAPPKIYERGRSPYESVNFTLNPIGAVCGPWDRYQCYKTTATIAFFVPDIDVVAVGGIVNPEHVVEMMMLGAKHVELSSGFFWKGRKLITDSVDFLSRFMDEQGYERIEELVGLGLKHMGFVDDSIDWEEDRIAAEVNKDECIKCGVCMDFYCPVPEKGEDGFPSINKVNCQGCGLCVAICPSNALSIERL